MNSRNTSSRDYLRKQEKLEESAAIAAKRLAVEQLKSLIRAQNLSRSELAVRLRTSRAALDRFQDDKNSALTLFTLAKIALALNHRVEIKLVPA